MTKERAFIANIYTRFLAKIKVDKFDTEKCWIWVGAGKGNGYGSMSVKGKTITAHRLSYQLFCGEVAEEQDVCHTCDNRYCVNPDHLFLGSRKDNMQDMKLKGRGDGGNRKHLKEDQVQEIRRRLLSGHSPRKIATQMNINYGTVTSIKRKDSYV